VIGVVEILRPRMQRPASSVSINVESLIDPALFKWLESIGLSAFPLKCIDNPARFVYWLVFTLLGDGTPVPAVNGNTPTERVFGYLRGVRSFLQTHEIAGAPIFPHLRAIASLSDPKAADQHEDGVALLNSLIQLLHDYLTPTITFQDEISGILAARERECQALVQEITAVAEENAFYREKIGRIESLLAAQNDGVDRQAIENVLNQLYESPPPPPPRIESPRAGADMRLGSLSPTAVRPSLRGMK
jgi:hypothetical protein